MLHTVFEPLRALFIHIPKCGGGTILRTLESHLDAPNSYKSRNKKQGRRDLVRLLEPEIGRRRARRFARGHEPFAIKKLILPAEVLDEYFKFSFVRNPYDRLYSAYNGFARKQKSLLARPRPELADINVFVKQYLNGRLFVDGQFDEGCLDEETLHIHFLPQEAFLCDDGEVRVDFLGRMESFDDDLARLCDRLGLAGVSQVTRHIQYRGDLSAPSRYLERYDDESRALVESLYSDDFDLLDYPRSDPASPR